MLLWVLMLWLVVVCLGDIKCGELVIVWLFVKCMELELMRGFVSLKFKSLVMLLMLLWMFIMMLEGLMLWWINWCEWVFFKVW